MAAALTDTLISAGCGGGEGSEPEANVPPPMPAFTDDRPGLASPSPAADLSNRTSRAPDPDDNAPPPTFTSLVTEAARSVGCTPQSFASEPDPTNHITGESPASLSNPPVSGAHNGTWADWGVYDQPVPYNYQLHNLEHGGVFIQYGTSVPVAAVNVIRELWAVSPACLLVSPNSTPAPGFPVDGVVVGSQQRWTSWKPFTIAQIPAIRAYLQEYRGKGPEGQPAGNDNAPRPTDLPRPVLPDLAAGDPRP